MNHHRSRSIFAAAISGLLLLGQTTANANLARLEEVRVGIVGKNLVGYGCWPSSAKGRKPELQVRVAGQWITKVKTRLYRDSSLCDTSQPWSATYYWRVDEFGEFPNPNSPRARDLFVRQFLPKSGKSRAVAGDAFLVMIYRSERDQALDFNDILKGILSSGS